MTEAMAEDNKDKLHIRLHVYDTEMSVNVVREDEKMYRDAAKLITDTVNTYADVFKGGKSDNCCKTFSWFLSERKIYNRSIHYAGWKCIVVYRSSYCGI